jgi:heat shock protein HtpX
MARQSLAARAALALVLMLGFYVLALGVAAGLLYLPYAEWRYADRVDLRLVVFSLAGGLGILGAIMPRVDRFPEPGPLLTPQSHPQLFSAIADVARLTHQAMPAQVFLVPEVNAWVAQRGGIMGFGGRRVMGLGLALMRVLSVAELRAVLAHEFGHFDAGDTALGPWLYKTRAAIGRTLESLKETASLLSVPFVWYGKSFVRLTHALSRQQEYAADNLAARTTGPTALRQGLEKIHRTSPAFPAFWHGEVIPLLEKGFRPPLAEGFSRFLAAPAIAGQVDTLFAQELAEGKSDPYDTHPSLKDRLAALAGLPELPSEPGEQSALSLLTEVDVLEQALLSFLAARGPRPHYKSTAWDDTATTVWLPYWSAIVAGNREHLAGLTPEESLKLLPTRGALAVRFALAATPEVASERQLREERYLVFCALSLALKDAGWSVRAPPGEEIVFVRGNDRFLPGQFLESVANGALTLDAAVAAVSEAGVAGRDFGTLEEPAPGPLTGQGTLGSAP